MLRLILLSSAVVGVFLTAQAANAAAPDGHNWSGFYLGATAGFADARHEATDLDYYDYGGTKISKTRGIAAGVTAGFNAQSGGLVYGVEGDFSWLSNKNQYLGNVVYNNNFNSNYTYRNRLSMLSTIRGRVGVTIDRALIYGTGGVALGKVKNSWGYDCQNSNNYNCNNIQGTYNPFSDRGTRLGYVLGGGMEYALSEHMSFKGEAIFASLDGKTVNCAQLSANRCGNSGNINNGNFRNRFDNSLTLIRAGVNFKF